MTPNEVYQKWCTYSGHPQDIQGELTAIAGREEEIADRFYKDLEFGTGGLRGVLGAGTNRMNVYTVRRATLGLATYIASLGREAMNKGVVVAYDCRRMSSTFAREAGLVLAAAGVRAYVFKHLCPTPELSYAVRHLGAAGGIMITASHNPPEYNGYKVYNELGGQILSDAANQIMTRIQAVKSLFDVPLADGQDAERKGLLSWIGDEVDDAYCNRVVETIRVPGVTNAEREGLRVVYTPLHGTGNVPVRRVLKEAGYTDVHVVAEQAEPDGEFSTVKSPNPEEPAALGMALALAKSVAADIAMGTDPDADRVGVAVRTGDGAYELLTGNQVGGLLVHFVLEQRRQAGTLPTNGVVYKTIVTSELGAEIARQYGVQVGDTLTGFKYIGDMIHQDEVAGSRPFLFGYEESYGYLAGDFVRDKDAVQICLLVAEMAAYCKARGITLMDALQSLYDRVGTFRETLVSATLPGRDGAQRITAVMKGLRSGGVQWPGHRLFAVEDYMSRTRTEYDQTGAANSESKIDLPNADVLKYCFEGGSWLAVRPSGTEPKIKFYLGARGDSIPACEKMIEQMKSVVQALLA